MTIRKRDGTVEPFMVEKFQRQVDFACEGIEHVSSSMIQIRTQLQYHDKITTSELDEMIYKAAEDLIHDPDVGHPNYQYVAGRIRLYSLRKQVYGSYQPPKLFDIVSKNVTEGVYEPKLIEWYTEAEWNSMEAFIEHSRDEHYSAAAISQLVDKYLIRNRHTGQLYETPQVRYMVAAAVAFHAIEDRTQRMQKIKKYYKAASKGKFTLPTPVLAGLGTKTRQFSSCVLIKTDDTLDSIYASGQIMGRYASKRAGIGLEVGRIRGVKSPIRNGEILHTGLVPFIRKWYGDLRCCSQGGIRNASCTVYYPIWHIDFEDLIVLKNNQGTHETRVRHLDYGVVMSKLFWRRYKENGQITLFDPNEVPDLYEAYYRDTEEFERLYTKYEQKRKLKKKTFSAQDIIRPLITERSDTGRIYIMNVDNVIKQGPFDTKKFPIYQSNLCAEILLPTKPFQHLDDDTGRIALCTLGSMNWGAFTKPEDMRESCHLLVESLSEILGYQDYLSIQSKLSTQEHEPLGIGITNLAYWHAKRGLKYGDPDALAEVKRWIEHQSYYLIEASVELAKRKGPCTEFHSSRYAKGVFPWELRAEGVNELTDFTPSPDLDWNKLRNGVITHGMRNNALGALPPVESSSVVIDSTNGISMPKALISIKDSKAGSLVQVVPDYERLKNKYQLMWDQTDCIGYLKTVAVLGAYTDQSISADTYYNPAHFSDRRVPGTLVARNIMLAHHWGVKTLYYNLFNKLGAKQTTDSQTVEEDCESCKL